MGNVVEYCINVCSCFKFLGMFEDVSTCVCLKDIMVNFYSWELLDGMVYWKSIIDRKEVEKKLGIKLFLWLLCCDVYF